MSYFPDLFYDTLKEKFKDKNNTVYLVYQNQNFFIGVSKEENTYVIPIKKDVLELDCKIPYCDNKITKDQVFKGESFDVRKSFDAGYLVAFFLKQMFDQGIIEQINDFNKVREFGIVDSEEITNSLNFILEKYPKEINNPHVLQFIEENIDKVEYSKEGGDLIIRLLNVINLKENSKLSQTLQQSYIAYINSEEFTKEMNRKKSTDSYGSDSCTSTKDSSNNSDTSSTHFSYIKLNILDNQDEFLELQLNNILNVLKQNSNLDFVINSYFVKISDLQDENNKKAYLKQYLDLANSAENKDGLLKQYLGFASSQDDDKKKNELISQAILFFIKQNNKEAADFIVNYKHNKDFDIDLKNNDSSNLETLLAEDYDDNTNSNIESSFEDGINLGLHLNSLSLLTKKQDRQKYLEFLCKNYCEGNPIEFLKALKDCNVEEKVRDSYFTKVFLESFDKEKASDICEVVKYDEALNEIFEWYLLGVAKTPEKGRKISNKDIAQIAIDMEYKELQAELFKRKVNEEIKEIRKNPFIPYKEIKFEVKQQNKEKGGLLLFVEFKEKEQPDSYCARGTKKLVKILDGDFREKNGKITDMTIPIAPGKLAKIYGFIILKESTQKDTTNFKKVSQNNPKINHRKTQSNQFQKEKEGGYVNTNTGTTIGSNYPGQGNSPHINNNNNTSILFV